MKNKFINLLGLFFLAAIIWSCEKEENRVVLESGTPPVLTSSLAGATPAIPLLFANKDAQALKITWTNPEYKFTTGTNSQNVSYQVEIDTTGANFTNPGKKVISISGDLSLTMTQGELNDYLLNQLQLNTTMTHNIEMRVKASLANNAGLLYSNVLKFTARPYAIPPKVAPPASGELYIVGNATPGGDATGWNNPVPVPTQKFTQVSPTFYTITIALNGDKSYLLLPVNGSWNAKYGAIGGNNSNVPLEDDFRDGGGDLKSPLASGNYRIEVDFQRGKYKLTKL